MVILRLGPILIYHYNILLVIGFLLSLFVIYHVARKRDYNTEKVLDWVIWASLFSLLSVSLASKVHTLNWTFLVSLSGFLNYLPRVLKWVLADWLWAWGVFSFVLFTYFLFRRWRWLLFPALDFTALGASFFLLVVAVSLPLPSVLSSFISGQFSLPLSLVNFLYFSALFYFLNRVYHFHYKEGRILTLWLWFSQHPLLMLAGVVALSVVEWRGFRLKLSGFAGYLWSKKLKELGQAVFAYNFKHLRSMSKVLKTKEHLEKEEEKLEERLEELSGQDPRSRPERVSENAPEEDADEAEAGARFAALKSIFVRRLKDVRTALIKLKGGSYGICDRCGEEIDPARLKAKPDARYCLKCTKELEKSGRV